MHVLLTRHRTTALGFEIEQLRSSDTVFNLSPKVSGAGFIDIINRTPHHAHTTGGNARASGSHFDTP
jgi:hypothetical protein